MNKFLLVSVMMLMLSGTAEAGVRQWFKNSVVYLYRPIPAAWNYVSNLGVCIVQSTITFTSEVIGNFNANPANRMEPIFPEPIPQPDPVPQPTE